MVSKSTKVMRSSGNKQIVWYPAFMIRGKGILTMLATQDVDALAQQEYFRLIIDGDEIFNLSDDLGVYQYWNLVPTLITNTRTILSDGLRMSANGLKYSRYCRLDYKRATAGTSGLTISAEYAGGLLDSQKDWALSFDGEDDDVTIPHNSIHSFSNTKFSVAFRINTTSAGATKEILSKSGSSQYFINVLSTGHIGASADDGVVTTTRNSASVVNDGKWHFIVCVYNNPNVDIYVDGQLNNGASSLNLLSIADRTTPIHIADEFVGTGHLAAIIDEVRLYNRSLFADEVRRMNGGERILNGLVLELLFDEQNAMDSSGYGINGVITGASPTPGMKD